jgi:hypothetical protein
MEIVSYRCSGPQNFGAVLRFWEICVELLRADTVYKFRPLYRAPYYYMYNEQTNAHLINSLLYCSVFVASTCFDMGWVAQSA